ncbi:hypothetical protein NECAME_04517 [Necator americanus]|uniref:DRBM domain-containing protein n=1 Tax=Necator americanus TaxID=51031 RepID=W2SUG9_NECAM|nr:hypothetical protein NECAME_04517 [Necator americanus]ETN72337.1 hypothetical protein NECAME_04517 [Necator americanus]
MVGFSPCVKENLYTSSHPEDDPKSTANSIGVQQAETACVPSRSIHPQPWCGQHQTNNDVSSRNVYNYSNQEDKEKTPMCRIAELARFHKLKHEYKLMDESGPAHKKMFTVQLLLTPEEIFEGSGASIKKAQQAAAAAALVGTSLAMPPEKKRKKDASSPSVLLSHVARRLGLPEPIYRSHNHQKMPLAPITPRFTALTSPPLACNGAHNGFDRTTYFPQDAFAPSTHPATPRIQRTPLIGPIPPVNPLFALVSQTPRSGPAYPVQPPNERLCMVSVAIGPGRVFTGIGNTFAQAKANAATQCLGYLGPHIQALDTKLKMDELRRKALLQKSTSEETTSNGGVVDGVLEQTEASAEVESVPKHKQKSVISQVHECALQMKLNVEFEVVKEVGPPHDRSYVVRCSLRNPKNEVVVETVGEGRKKKEATQNACANVLTRLRGIENSPIFIASSLYKLQKRVLNPSKEPKRKTIIKVSCGARVCCGSGPNKRLAKRAAAEAMLAEIGYVKPLPPPGKSLLKKKMDSQLNIVFDPSDLVTPPVPEDAVISSNNHMEQQESHESDERTIHEGLLALCVDEQNDQQGGIWQQSPESETRGDSPGNVPPSPGRRRVTFSNQVKACPPPDDSKYPEPELAPLKADVLVEGRVKRIRRTKEAKRALSDDQKCEIREIARATIQTLQAPAIIPCGEGSPDSEACQMRTAKRRLEILSESFKFSVQYTNFPKSPDGSDPLYFALVSLGLERPIVCHGRGSTTEAAAENAAFNAITNLCTYDQPASPHDQIGTVPTCN